MQRLSVALVEIAPDRPLAGDLGHGSRRKTKGGHVVDEPAGRRGQAGVGGHRQLHRHQCGSPIGGDEAGRRGLGGRVDDGRGAGRAVEVGDELLEARGIGGDGVALAVDDDGGFGADLGEVAA